ncbi:hypothetical protein K490DRAFT_36028 [Saccharata proteae CBS 121410]|uniref:Sodium bile acid symporter family protein n=1 Tax=Saccharata proteae CBS 121410 TaxID=1314787 RepID=A0A9P4HZM6_9PEZI|nr:hypothetical protein K490DRAFT_36028 [Saccharata proteae CBS 121410]
MTTSPPLSEANAKTNTKSSRYCRIISIILHQWLLIGIAVACILAYFFPHIAAHGGVIRSQYSILYGAVALIFLISGLSISSHALLIHALNWRLHLLVQGASFLLAPVTMYALVQVISAGDPEQKIDRGVLVGYILTACIPTTIASNVMMTRSAGGDDAAALVEVLIGNVFGPVLSPVWTVALIPKGKGFEAWEGVSGDLDAMYRNVFKLLGLSVYLPLVVGQAIRWKWRERTSWVMQRFYLNKVGTFMLLLLIWTSFSSCFATSALQSLNPSTIVFVLLFNIAIYLFWTLICFFLAHILPNYLPSLLTTIQQHLRIKEPLYPSFPARITIAICFCGPAKTAALGIPLLYAMWDSFDELVKAKISIPLILYTTEQIVCAHFLVLVFKSWMRRGEKNEKSGIEVGVEEGDGGVWNESVPTRSEVSERDSIRPQQELDVEIQDAVYEKKG